MDARVRRFRAEALRQGVGSVGKRYPLELRRLAVSVAQERQAEPLSQVAADLGISTVSLQRWLEQAEPAQFRPVELRCDPEPDFPSSSGLTLITPRGYRVEGLSLESMALLLRALG